MEVYTGVIVALITGTFTSLVTWLTMRGKAHEITANSAVLREELYMKALQEIDESRTGEIGRLRDEVQHLRKEIAELKEVEQKWRDNIDSMFAANSELVQSNNVLVNKLSGIEESCKEAHRENVVLNNELEALTEKLNRCEEMLNENS